MKLLQRKIILPAVIVIAVLSTALLLVLPTLSGESFEIHGDAMLPTYSAGVKVRAVETEDLHRGDIVVFKPSDEEDTVYVRRIIGLPGETVELRSGKVIVKNHENPSGDALEEPYTDGSVTKPESEAGQSGSKTTHWELDEGEYFMLGDNRKAGQSIDSRVLGPVAKDSIIGKVRRRS